MFRNFVFSKQKFPVLTIFKLKDEIEVSLKLLIERTLKCKNKFLVESDLAADKSAIRGRNLQWTSFQTKPFPPSLMPATAGKQTMSCDLL